MQRLVKNTSRNTVRSLLRRIKLCVTWILLPLLLLLLLLLVQICMLLTKRFWVIIIVGCVVLIFLCRRLNSRLPPLVLCVCKDARALTNAARCWHIKRHFACRTVHEFTDARHGTSIDAARHCCWRKWPVVAERRTWSQRHTFSFPSALLFCLRLEFFKKK